MSSTKRNSKETVSEPYDEFEEKLLKEINGEFGSGMILRADKEALNVDPIHTFLPTLDEILSGGIPRGKIIEIYGNEGSGKTTIALQIIAENQKVKSDFKAVFIDSEHALNIEYAKGLGINMKNFWISQPRSAEETFAFIQKIANYKFDILVIDSIASLVPESEADANMGEVNVASLARVLSSCVKRIIKSLEDNGTTLICLNQLRSNVKILTFGGQSDITAGGKTLKYFSCLRLEMTRIAMVKNQNEVIGSAIRFKTVKSKFSKPFRETVLDLYFGQGFSKEADLIEFAVSKKVLSKSGSWYVFENKSIAQGKENLVNMLVEDRELYDSICLKISKDQA